MGSGGDRDGAFDELFEGFFSDLMRVAYRITGRPEVAEELCQEAFLRYYERRDRLPGGLEARYWLIRVVKNLAFNHEKRRGRERAAYQAFTLDRRDDLPNEGERGILAEESRKAVQDALLSLPYNLRIALILKEYGGYKYGDIARITGTTEGNVKVRVFRARQRLAELLKQEDIHVP